MKNKHNYPANWVDTIRPEVLKRDNYTCQHCGLKHRVLYVEDGLNGWVKIDKEEYIEALRAEDKTKKIFLQVAHLDHNPKNCEMENLLSLCCSCHLNNDRVMNNLKRKMKKS